MTWTLEGENDSAVQTKRFKSVTGPLLVFGDEDTHDILVLDKVVPGPLHLYLSCESSGEALHHIWKRLIEGQGEVKNKPSDAFEKSTY